MVDNNISFLETNLMRLTMELVEWMELEMIELNKSAKYQGSIAEIKLFNALRGEEKSISELMEIEEKLAWSIGERNLEFMRIILAGHSKKLKVCD
jgi:hypothetical protein